MERKITITQEENDEVYKLFSTYMSYMSMLQYLGENSTNTEIYDRKWAEAVELNIKLDKLKKDIEKKYKPAGNWNRFEFDFDNNQVVFIGGDT